MFGRRKIQQKYCSAYQRESRNKRIFKSEFSGVKKIAHKICIVFLFGGIFYAIFFTPVLAIKSILVEGNKTINEEEIKEIAMDSANRKFFNVVNNNLIFIKVSDIERAIAARFNSVNAVKVEKKFPATLKIIIAEKPADISWCNKIKIEKVAKNNKTSDNEISRSEIAQCYLSDEEGIIYQKIANEPAPNSVKVYRNEPISIGLKIGSEEIKNFARKLSNNFNRKTGLAIDYLYIPDLSSRELHLYTADGWKIYFDLNRSADEQIEILNYSLKNGLTEEERKKMDYIDLRIIDRFIYKVK